MQAAPYVMYMTDDGADRVEGSTPCGLFVRCHSIVFSLKWVITDRPNL